MMRPLLLSLLLTVACPLALKAQMECTINHVDAAHSTISLERNRQVGVFHVTPKTKITLDDADAAFSALKPGMRVILTTSDPGTAAQLEARGMPTPSPSASNADGFTDQQITQSKTVTVTARDLDGFSISNVRKGEKFYLQYVRGNWKHHGTIAQFNPDNENTPDESRLVIARPKAEAETGDVIAVVPANTAKRAFVFTSDQDYPALVLRINSKPSKNPGKVDYKVTIIPAPH